MIHGGREAQPLAENENRYLYNGKEYQARKWDNYGYTFYSSLHWYDYGARFYDAQLGRWHSVDPLAEKYYDWSLYNYVAGNPVNSIDPDGKWIEKNVTRYYKDKEGNLQEKQWYNILKKTVHKDVDIIVHNALLYNSVDGTKESIVKNNLVTSIKDNWNKQGLRNKRGNKTININVTFKDGIQELNSLDDIRLKTDGEKPSTLFLVVNNESMEKLEDASTAGYVPNRAKNLAIIHLGALTKGRATSAHEFGHMLGLPDNYYKNLLMNGNPQSKKRWLHFSEANNISSGDILDGYTSTLNSIRRKINK